MIIIMMIKMIRITTKIIIYTGLNIIRKEKNFRDKYHQQKKRKEKRSNPLLHGGQVVECNNCSLDSTCHGRRQHGLYLQQLFALQRKNT